MINLLANIEQKLKETIINALNEAVKEGILDGEISLNFTIEIPSNNSHGDFASNAAMVLAKNFRKSPREIAEIIINKIDINDDYIDKVESAGPGFLNFKLKSKWFSEVVEQINTDKKDYGCSDIGKGQKVNVEYVSANPTGAMHMGNARGGVLGDTLSTAFEMSGYDVTKEFYVNDAGNQVLRLGASLEARYIELHKGKEFVYFLKDDEEEKDITLKDGVIFFPRDGYHGEDVISRVKEYSQIHGEDLLKKSSKEIQKTLIDFTLPINIGKLKSDLDKYKVVYDNWFLESTLHADGSVDEIIEILKKTDYTYEEDGVFWFKSTAFGSDKDDVLVRENKIPTYFLVDIAYHYNKFVKRGFDKAINIWGADHHGHVDRLINSLTTVGIEKGRLDILLMQMVRLVRDKKVVKMSKRTGKAITLTDLIEEVPIDAARFFFNLREPNMAYDFDLDLAIKEERENPVYYVQYVYARVCSILKNLKAESNIDYEKSGFSELKLLTHSSEKDLISHLSLFPEKIKEVTINYDSSLITKYAVEVATKFHKFYHDCKIKGSEKSLLMARLNLAFATQIVVKNILDMLKVDAPEIM